jgi:hypothetical protein
LTATWGYPQDKDIEPFLSTRSFPQLFPKKKNVIHMLQPSYAALIPSEFMRDQLIALIVNVRVNNFKPVARLNLHCTLTPRVLLGGEWWYQGWADGP